MAAGLLVARVAEHVGRVESNEAAVSADERNDVERPGIDLADVPWKRESLIPSIPLLLGADRTLLSGIAACEEVVEVAAVSHRWTPVRSRG